MERSEWSTGGAATVAHITPRAAPERLPTLRPWLTTRIILTNSADPFAAGSREPPARAARPVGWGPARSPL